MDDSVRTKYEARSQELKTELKIFEGKWAKRHGGLKPSHKDIKDNPVIAQKYKRYNEVRDVLSGKTPVPKEVKKQKQKSAKASCEDDHMPIDTERTPRRSKPNTDLLDGLETPSLTRTPRRPKHNTDLLDGWETPSLNRLFSPILPTSIGPTPQKNGRVLGLFDLLYQEAVTPSRLVDGTATSEGAALTCKLQATPSKRKHEGGDTESPAKLHTPRSASQRALHSVITPLGRSDGNRQAVEKTPESLGKLQFQTPAFLRRAPLPTVDEEGIYVSPSKKRRLPGKLLMRGLSSVVAGLRKLEEEALDDELEALREMEEEGDGSQPARPPKSNKTNDDILVPDSQGPQLLGGFDEEGLYDSEPEEQLDRGGRPLTTYKKKGQKRTTRRVNMKPTVLKRPNEPADGVVRNAGTADAGDDDEIIPETQFDSTKSDMEAQALASGSEFADSGEDSEEKEQATAEAKAKKFKAANALKKDAKPQVVKKEGTLKKAAKKVNELAHANFKRLKLKNNGAKGGAGFGSRFRRRK